MKWINRNDSESNYEDRRGRGVKRGAAFGGVGMIWGRTLFRPSIW